MNNRRKQLIEASIDLFAAGGFWNTPTTQITQHANVATGTLFNYFESKEVLIDSVYGQLRHEWVSYVLVGYPDDESIKARYEHIWFRHIDWSLKNPKRHALLRQLRIADTVKNNDRDRQDEQLSFMYALAQEGFDNELFDSDLSVDYLGSLLRVHLEAAVRHAMRHNLADMKLVKHIAKGFEIFWRAVSDCQ